MSRKSASYLHPERTASANEIRNELAASRSVPSPLVDEQDDDLPSRKDCLACEVCVAAGEGLKRRGLRAILGAFDG